MPNLVTEIFEGHQILRLSETIQPATTEGESSEVLVDRVEEVLRAPESSKGCVIAGNEKAT